MICCIFVVLCYFKSLNMLVYHFWPWIIFLQFKKCAFFIHIIFYSHKVCSTDYYHTQFPQMSVSESDMWSSINSIYVPHLRFFVNSHTKITDHARYWHDLKTIYFSHQSTRLKLTEDSFVKEINMLFIPPVMGIIASDIEMANKVCSE